MNETEYFHCETVDKVSIPAVLSSYETAKIYETADNVNIPAVLSSYHIAEKVK